MLCRGGESKVDGGLKMMVVRCGHLRYSVWVEAQPWGSLGISVSTEGLGEPRPEKLGTDSNCRVPQASVRS